MVSCSQSKTSLNTKLNYCELSRILCVKAVKLHFYALMLGLPVPDETDNKPLAGS